MLFLSSLKVIIVCNEMRLESYIICDGRSFFVYKREYLDYVFKGIGSNFKWYYL